MASVLHIEGVASLALLPDGCISGHLIDAVTKMSYGIFGKEIKCERECSRGEDYKLVDLTILEFKSQKECTLVVEQRGADAARIRTAEDAHGWEEEVLEAAREGRSGAPPNVTFDCETLKADADARRHIQRFLPTLEGQDAVVNVGKMVASGVKFEATKSNRKRDSEEAFFGDVSRGHDERGSCGNTDEGRGEWLAKKWKLEEGADGGGWFTRTTESKTEVVTSEEKGRSNGCSKAGDESGGTEAIRQLHEGTSSERAQVSETAGSESQDEEKSRARTGNLVRNAEERACFEGTLRERLRSIEEAIGLPSEGQLRPTPLSRKLIEEDDTDKEGWL
ncbi:hypothetical protein KFL_000090530 [Klebsormidium nitens]|uniref:Uncharacterized protein n=1 Tax=Klebsormidium nitens TaxID=105231 RepID=A0A1Y1HNS4_KLENI|nr:hypothetical protein KFL_000090530 [Klebsormidium nitens]|eukprot:GAQ78207.1 hypothetical protein KFL_000090530 [Klebsormidium nitens]